MASFQRLPGPRRAIYGIQSIRQTRLNHTINHRFFPSSPSPSPSRSATATTKRSFKTPSVPIRTYYSDLHPRLPPHEYTNSQTAILTASLPHVPTHGFTSAALTAGARDAGFLDVSVQLLPRGEFDLVLFWLASRRGLLRAKVESGEAFGTNGEGLSVQEKIKILVLERLRMNCDVKDVWQDVGHTTFFSPLPLVYFLISGSGLCFANLDS